MTGCSIITGLKMYYTMTFLITLQNIMPILVALLDLYHI